MKDFSSGDQQSNLLRQAGDKYSDPFLTMSSEELLQYQGMIVAILDETGEIIAKAATLKELEQAVQSSSRGAEAWSYRDVPSVNSPH